MKGEREQETETQRKAERKRERGILNFSASGRNFADLRMQLIRQGAHSREYGASSFREEIRDLKLRGAKRRNQHGGILGMYSFLKNGLGKKKIYIYIYQPVT